MMRPKRALPSLEELNEWFVEDPPGVLRWRKDYFSDRSKGHLVGKAGEVAGHAAKGRVQISLHRGTYFRSRLIYKIHKGKDPHGVVDHINQDTLDDRFENLKDEATSLNVRRTRDRDSDYFVVTARTEGDGRTVKTVTLSWRCKPGEDADAIAAELNTRNEEYLRGFNREQQAKRREALREVLARVGVRPSSVEEKEQQVV